MKALQRVSKKGLKTTGNAGQGGSRLQSRFHRPQSVTRDLQAFRAARREARPVLHPKFPFELLADRDKAVCKQFGVMKLKSMCGKKVRGIEHSTFVLDENGVLAREWRGVKVPGHPQEVLNFVKAL